MSRIYLATCTNGTEIGLFKQNGATDLPFVILRDSHPIMFCDSMHTAYREYNNAIVKEGM